MKPGFLTTFLFKYLILLVFIFGSCLTTAEAAQQKKEKTVRPALAVTKMNEKNPKYAAIVIDADSGVILHEENADAIRYPASLTKLMTSLLVFEEIDSGRMNPNDRITVSRAAAAQAPSKLGLQPGTTIRVQDALGAISTKSANDMAVALAEAVSGSESAFAKRMTQKAQQIGMSRTRFYNASGLPNTAQVTTARDMARLARYILKNHPQQSKLFSKQNFVYQGRTYANHNHLMKDYEGMDCCKTGYINASGFNLVASAKRGGKRVIGAVFGGKSAVSRNLHMASLMDNGFKNMAGHKTQIAKAEPAPLPYRNENRQAASQPPARTNSRTGARTVEPPAIVASLPQTSGQYAPFTQAGSQLPLPSPQGNAQAETRAIQQAVNDAQPAPVKSSALNTSDFQVSDIGKIRMHDKIVTTSSANKQPSYSGQQNLGTLRLASLNTSSGTDNGASGSNTPEWAIQIGAYETRSATDQALYNAQKTLPQRLYKNQSLVVPLRTADATWMFRARLAGYTQNEAAEACRYFTECLTISPRSY